MMITISSSSSSSSIIIIVLIIVIIIIIIYSDISSISVVIVITDRGQHRELLAELDLPRSNIALVVLKGPLQRRLLSLQRRHLLLMDHLPINRRVSSKLTLATLRDCQLAAA
jgi:uncharacterized SAM-binding protein YcdF (DUF218 family)